MGACKALLMWQGETFLARLVRLMDEAGCTPIVVVTGAWPLEVPTPAVRVHAADWALGMRASLRAGLSAVPMGRACLITHVDRPAIERATLEALIRAEPLSETCAPHFRGESGHPVRVPARHLSALAAPDDDRPLRDALAALGRVVGVPVDDAGVLQNFNAPSDLPGTPRT